MTCADVRAILSAFEHRAPTIAECAAMGHHLPGCPDCLAAAEEFRKATTARLDARGVTPEQRAWAAEYFRREYLDRIEADPETQEAQP